MGRRLVAETRSTAMSVRLLVADALHLIDEHASAMPEGAYLELSNKMKRIYDQTHDQVHEPGAPEDVIGHLVALLSGGTADYGLIAACVRALSDLVESALMEDTELEANALVGVMPTIIALLSVDSDEIKARAAEALLKLVHFFRNWTTITLSGAIPPLVDLLRANSDDVKENAARALATLARNADHAATIASADGIPPLIALLSGSPYHIKVPALQTLDILSDCGDNHMRIVCFGALPPLIALLSGGSEEVRAQAAKVLKVLALNADNKATIASVGGIPPLTALLSGSGDVRKHAKQVLTQLGLHALCRPRRGRKRMKASHAES